MAGHLELLEQLALDRVGGKSEWGSCCRVPTGGGERGRGSGSR